MRLSLAEREEISRGLAGDESLRVIAVRLGRASSTVSREVAANGGRRRYRACRADERSLRERGDPSSPKLARCERLRAIVEAKLELRWSPPQISRWLVRAFPNDPEMRRPTRRSTCRFVQARGALRKELTRYLRSGHVSRRPRGHSTYNGQGRLRGILKNATGCC